MTRSELALRVAETVEKTKASCPLAGSITNAVTVNLVANAQLAVGGSAAMVNFADEAEGLIEVGGAFYVNMGALFPVHAESIPKAARAACDRGKTLVLDPVGIGLGEVRTRILLDLKSTRPLVVRGNASEIIALSRLWELELSAGGAGPRGVDASDEVEDALPAALALARFTGGAVAVSGAIDLVTDGSRIVRCGGGSPLMTKVTGMGCSLGGVVAVYAAQADPFTAALTGVLAYNRAGRRAEAIADAPSSFQAAFIDELYRATGKDVAAQPFELEEV
ncbi:hydroxyethylthiazole kinase [Gordonibacter sp. Marseille-P4307]|uniref:hydroxyethylthiazole kinase n=1 Tax=Gordonibacter sp. Marseille-P4307 TaxID=2161815 RepID=UPI000F52A73F|nr:hydroxyethylthiazole kinase [Gordonibacter sp. Marseille-P4307]